MHGIGLMGFGVVGSGVYEMMENKKGPFSTYFTDAKILKVLVRDLKKARKSTCSKEMLTCDADDLLEDSNIKTLIFAMGGTDISVEYMKRAIKNGKNIITANKAAVAPHLKELLELAKENNVAFFIEATTGGGMPVIDPIKQQAMLDEIYSIKGILNGTCNYILTELFKEPREFSEILKTAQELGVAEADPSDDIGGMDTARKLGILSSIAYHKEIVIKEDELRGIETIGLQDILYLKRKGFVVKMIGCSVRENDRYDYMVSPMVLEKNSRMGQIDGAMNGVVIEGKYMDSVDFKGLGAGQMPTANAVVSDLIRVLSGQNGWDIKLNQEHIKRDENLIEKKYYLRISDVDKTNLDNCCLELKKFGLEISEKSENSIFYETKKMSRSELKKIVAGISSSRLKDAQSIFWAPIEI
jgi:homoserine dehydrogenase